MSKSKPYSNLGWCIDRISKIFSSDSKSLWNFTVAPGRRISVYSNIVGWTKAEAEVLRCAIMKYGIGSWKQVSNLKLLPGKTVSQIVCQVQRMIGQQSLKGFIFLFCFDSCRVFTFTYWCWCCWKRKCKENRCTSKEWHNRKWWTYLICISSDI